MYASPHPSSPPAHLFFCHHRTLHACRMTPLTQPEAAPSSRGGRIYSILRKLASNLALRISDLDRYRLNMWEVSWAAPKESRKEHRENKATAIPKGNATPKARSLFSRGSSSSSEVPPFCKRRNVETISPTVSVSSSAKTSATSYHDESDSISTFSISSEQTTVHISKIVDLRNRRNGQLIDTTRPSTGMYIARGVSQMLMTVDLYVRDTAPDDLPSPTLTTSSTPWDTETLESVILRPRPLLQTLSSDSFVKRSTEATTTPRIDSDAPYLVNCGVTITASIVEPSTIKSKLRGRSTSSQSVTTIFDHCFGANIDRTPPAIEPLPPRPQSSRSYVPKPKAIRRMASSSTPLRAEPSSDAWKPPNEWGCTPTEPFFPSRPTPSPGPEIPKELTSMQLDVKYLARESNFVRLLRLTEAQDVAGPPSSSRDLEVEKMQWMLSAMYNLDGPIYPDVSQDDMSCEPSDPPKKVLALYETPGKLSQISLYGEQRLTYLSCYFVSSRS